MSNKERDESPTGHIVHTFEQEIVIHEEEGFGFVHLARSLCVSLNSVSLNSVSLNELNRPGLNDPPQQQSTANKPD